MREVICDTSPLQYLHQTGRLVLLAELYGEILVPEAVAHEIAVGRSLGTSLPELDAVDWIQIVSAPSRRILPMVVDLGLGEREVLALAAERPGALAILDDGLARRFARHLEISMTGTLGVLVKAKKTGHLETVRPVLDELESLGFRLDQKTRAAVLELASES